MLRTVALPAEELAPPQAATPARKAKAPRAPSGPVQEIIAAWQAEYLAATGDVYVLHPGDAPAVAALVKRAPITASDARDRARLLLDAQDAFWITNRNLRTLATRWSDVASIPVADAARAAAKAPPKSFAAESFENLITSAQDHEAAARLIARPDTSRLPPGATARSLAEQQTPARQLRALPRQAGLDPDRDAVGGR